MANQPLKVFLEFKGLGDTKMLGEELGEIDGLVRTLIG